ncbi:heme NO-binding domain-containing protein [Marivita sp. S0852]|uniref:heme NO-binding domain-containing protein n=1 Tax=Marivita sp. S0852 TaxID=3373893 RepID=UPI003981D311
MHGLIFRTIEAFVTDGFGSERWENALALAGLQGTSFEAMFQYDDAYLPKVLDGCAVSLSRTKSSILEDIGTYLITRQNYASIRRLMRFGGDTFVELLLSLDDLPGRTRLAVSGLDLPQITVREHTPMTFTIYCKPGPKGFGHVLVGLLRAMADDYGALVVVEHQGTEDGCEIINITVIDTCFAEDRGFSLATTATGGAL